MSHIGPTKYKYTVKRRIFCTWLLRAVTAVGYCSAASFILPFATLPLADCRLAVPLPPCRITVCPVPLPALSLTVYFVLGHCWRLLHCCHLPLFLPFATMPLDAYHLAASATALPHNNLPLSRLAESSFTAYFACDNCYCLPLVAGDLIACRLPP